MKLEQFSAIVLLNLDRSFDISQQWQFSILSSPKIVLNQRNSEPKKHASNYSSGKNSSFSQLHFFTREVDQYKNTSLTQLYQTPRTLFLQNMYHQLLSSCEYCKVFQNNFLYTPRCSSKQVLLSFANFPGKNLCWSLFLKKTCRFIRNF